MTFDVATFLSLEAPAQTQAGNAWGGQHPVNVNYQSIECALPFSLPFLHVPSPASGEELTCLFLIKNIRKAINNKGTYGEEGKEATGCLHRQMLFLLIVT